MGGNEGSGGWNCCHFFFTFTRQPCRDGNAVGKNIGTHISVRGGQHRDTSRAFGHDWIVVFQSDGDLVNSSSQCLSRRSDAMSLIMPCTTGVIRSHVPIKTFFSLVVKRRTKTESLFILL